MRRRFFATSSEIIDYSKEYLTIKNTGESTLTLRMVKYNTSTRVSISYKTSTTGWATTSGDLSIKPHESIMFKGTLKPSDKSYGIGTLHYLQQRLLCSH